jgi:hypothetical protein
VTTRRLAELGHLANRPGHHHGAGVFADANRVAHTDRDRVDVLQPFVARFGCVNSDVVILADSADAGFPPNEAPFSGVVGAYRQYPTEQGQTVTGETKSSG